MCNRERWVFVSLVTSSFVASIGGIIVLARVSGAGPTLGASYVLPVFAAAFLGATQFQPGRFNVWGTVLAVYLLGTGPRASSWPASSRGWTSCSTGRR